MNKFKRMWHKLQTQKDLNRAINNFQKRSKIRLSEESFGEKYFNQFGEFLNKEYGIDIIKAKGTRKPRRGKFEMMPEYREGKYSWRKIKR